MRRYNAVVTFRPSTSLLLTTALLAIATVACNRAPENKDAVREGLMQHLSQNTGLDLQSMDVEVGNVTFQGNQATASVAFKPKSSPDAGMSMNYTLERRGDKWVVQQKAGAGAAHGTGAGMPPAGNAPGGMPPASGGGAEALPQGHPPVSPDAGSKGGTSALPPGHPPTTTQPAQPQTK